MNLPSANVENNPCLEFAREGEKLYKCGDFSNAVVVLQSAIELGTPNLSVLSFIYTQAANAHFKLSQYDKAIDLYRMGLKTAQSSKNRSVEARATYNLANALNTMNRFDESVKMCQFHLEICRKSNDKFAESRAIYNLANVHHTKGKYLTKNFQKFPNDLPSEAKECLEKAKDLYRENLLLVTVIEDKLFEGKILGNLGNIHYMLGNFKDSIFFHTRRLKIAREFGDKEAQIRAHCNLGNAHVSLNELNVAISEYLESLQLARELHDRTMEGQACYSIGNAYCITGNFEKAIEYLMYHLKISQKIKDRIGEGHSCWLLTNSLSALGRNSEALDYAKKHLEISQELKDETALAGANSAIIELKKLVTSSSSSSCRAITRADSIDSSTSHLRTCVAAKVSSLTPKLTKRFSIDHHMQFNRLSSCMGARFNQNAIALSNIQWNMLQPCNLEECNRGEDATFSLSEVTSIKSLDFASEDENLLDLLEHCQGSRMNDQRCSIDINCNKENRTLDNIASGTMGKKECSPVNSTNSIGNRRRIERRSSMLSRSMSTPVYPDCNSKSNADVNPLNAIARSGASSRDSWPDEMFDLIAGIQGKRMDEQRAQPPSRRTLHSHTSTSSQSGDSSFAHQLTVKMSQQRNLNASTNSTGSNANRANRNTRQMSLDTNVRPDDDFFEMLMRCQSSRLEDQRSSLPPTTEEISPKSSLLKRSSQCAT